MQFGVIAFVKRDSVLGDANEDIPAMGKAVIHLLTGVDDEIDWRPHRLSDRLFGIEACFELRPICYAVGQPDAGMYPV